MMRILGATAILGMMLAANAAPAAAPQGVAAEWSFAEASGAAVADSSGVIARPRLLCGRCWL